MEVASEPVKEMLDRLEEVDGPPRPLSRVTKHHVGMGPQRRGAPGRCDQREV